MNGRPGDPAELGGRSGLWTRQKARGKEDQEQKERTGTSASGLLNRPIQMQISFGRATTTREDGAGPCLNGGVGGSRMTADESARINETVSVVVGGRLYFLPPGRAAAGIEAVDMGISPETPSLPLPSPVCWQTPGCRADFVSLLIFCLHPPFSAASHEPPPLRVLTRAHSQSWPASLPSNGMANAAHP